MNAQLILIDGYNVIRRTEALRAAERRSLEAGREALLGWLAGRYRATPHSLIVVFDGDGASEASSVRHRWSRCRVVYSCSGEPADAVIARIAAVRRAGGEDVRVYTDDLEVRAAVSGAGGQPDSVESLQRQVNAPDRFRRKQAAYREHVRRQLARDDDR
ncbi:MAG: NYN domain-containing protein [Ktedonobacterales bacterium]